ASPRACGVRVPRRLGDSPAGLEEGETAMRSYPVLGRWLAGLVTCATLGAVVVLALSSREEAEKEKGSGAIAATADSWPRFGGNPDRNFVNTHVKNLPVEWDVKKKTNIRWVADLGSKAYGGPIVAGGKVLVGTNNQKPREKSVKVDGKDVPLIQPDGEPVDLGIIMCFDEGNGAFQWQQVFFKLKAGMVNDWHLEGICSTPVVEGSKLYYVSNR